MMSSVIPARLQFQCGHAALVTLPRIKGETATQRNDRVAREKSAALARQCDFCAPSVVVAANGNSHVAEVPAPQPVAAEPEVVTLAAIEPIAAVVETILEEAVPELELVVETLLEVDAAVPEVVAAAVAEALSTETTDTLESVATLEAPTPINATPAPAPRRRAPIVTRKARAAEVARGRRFLVEYRVERVLHAVDIHDALRKAANFGAARLTAITRED
jgi:hypothetical protein